MCHAKYVHTFDNAVRWLPPTDHDLLSSGFACERATRLVDIKILPSRIENIIVSRLVDVSIPVMTSKYKYIRCPFYTLTFVRNGVPASCKRTKSDLCRKWITCACYFIIRTPAQCKLCNVIWAVVVLATAVRWKSISETTGRNVASRHSKRLSGGTGCDPLRGSVLPKSPIWECPGGWTLRWRIYILFDIVPPRRLTLCWPFRRGRPLPSRGIWLVILNCCQCFILDVTTL
jgi:hypothetical protein